MGYVNFSVTSSKFKYFPLLISSINQVVDTVYSLLDVAKDGAADVVNIKVQTKTHGGGRCS